MQPSPIVFVSPRLRCRPLRCRPRSASDLGAIEKVYGDADGMRWVGDGSPITPEAAARWLGVTEANYARRGYGMFALEDRASGDVVGFAGIVHPGDQPQPEVKYALARAHWGRGLATEAVRHLLVVAHDTYGLTDVIATVAPEHVASQRVLAKAGMAYRAERRDPDGNVTLVYGCRLPVGASTAGEPTAGQAVIGEPAVDEPPGYEPTLLERLRALCLALPEVEERLSHGEPAWFVRGKRQIACFADRHHDDRVAFWCAAPPSAQEAFVANHPDRYFRPPYVGHRGWLGIYLDVPIDWEEIDEHLRDAYRNVAPKALAGALPGRASLGRAEVTASAPRPASEAELLPERGPLDTPRLDDRREGCT